MVHTKLLGALLLALVACCSEALEIKSLKLNGEFPGTNFLLTNDVDSKHKFLCTLGFKEGEVEGKNLHIRITGKMENAEWKILDQVIEEATKDYEAQAYITWPATLPADFNGKVNFVAEIYKEGGTKPTPPIKPMSLTVQMLDVVDASEPTDISVTKEPCKATVNVKYPFTFPKVIAECGACTEEGGKCELKKDNAPYFSSEDSGSKWTATPDETNKRISLSLKNQDFPLTEWTYKKDLKKYIKCQMKYRVKKDTYKMLRSLKIEINVDKKINNCKKNKNPFKVAMDKIGNSYEERSKENIRSCSGKDILETTSNYECMATDAKQKQFLTHCNEEGVWLYSDGLNEFKELTKKIAEDAVEACNYKFKNLTVLPVQVQSAYPNIINKEDTNQDVTCSFMVGKQDFKEGKYTVYAQLKQDGKVLPTKKQTEIEAKDLPKDGGLEQFSIEGLKLKTADLILGRTTKLMCEITVDEFPGTKPKPVDATELPVFDIHAVADKSDAHVDGGSCRVKLNEIYRSYTNPELFAFCGVWTASSTAQYPNGKWLEGPDAKQPNASFSSETEGVWKTKKINDMVQLKLEDKSINMVKLDGSKVNWLKCIFRSDKDKAAGVFSDYKQLIDHHTDADKCADNPVESLDLKKSHAKMVVNEEVKSCYKGKNVKTSVTVKCENTNSFSVVSCKNGQYLMHSGGKVINYNKNTMTDFLKHCSSGTRGLLASNSLLVAVILFLFFKSQ